MFLKKNANKVLFFLKRHNKIFLNVFLIFLLFPLQATEEDEKYECLHTGGEEHLATWAPRNGALTFSSYRREQVASNVEGGHLVGFYLVRRVRPTSDYITSKYWRQFPEYFACHWAIIPRVATCNNTLDSMSQEFPGQNFIRSISYYDWDTNILQNWSAKNEDLYSIIGKAYLFYTLYNLCRTLE